jgi:hypothetical protein
MTKTEIVSTFKAALNSVGYDEARMRRNYDFCDLMGSTAQVRCIPLAAFAGYPQSYRNARVGVIFADEPVEDAAKNCRALGAPLLMTVQNGTVQPWAAGLESVKPAGKLFRLQDTEGAFDANRNSWGPDALGRVKNPGDVSARSQPDLFDTNLGSALQRRFQIRLKDLLERSFKEIEAAYKAEHGRDPKVSALFAFMFRFVTAKIFMDRADAEGWAGLSEPLEILKAAEKQTGLLERQESDFLRKSILDAAWASVSRNLHFQNLSVPDLAFVAESAFITNRTRAELGVHSTPEGLAGYIVDHLPWEQVPVDERVIWEPFCGHGVFLAKAMERMRLDIHPSVNPSGRHEYFRERLIGVEKDPLALEICRVMLTNTDYPNHNNWERLHLADVFHWPEWKSTSQSAAVVLANPPYEAFTKTYRREIGATKTKPPAEFLYRLLQQAPRLIGLVLPQSFLSDPIYQDANRLLARLYDSIQIVELPRIFRYANNETIALMASGLRKEGRSVLIHYAEVRKDGVERFLEDWNVSHPRSEDVPVPPATGGSRFTLRLLPAGSVFPNIKTQLKLGDVVTDIHKGVNWIARTDGKSQAEPRTDVAADKQKKGFCLGAEKMNGNLTQFQLRSLRYLSLLDKDQDPSTRANKRPWEKRKSVCNAARFQPLSPWRLAAFADAKGLGFTKQYFAIWPKEGVSEFAITAILASPVANAFSFEHDLDRDNHIETLRRLPLPDLKHLQPEGELHRRAAELQRLLTVPEILAQPPAPEAVIEAVLRLDAAVLAAYGFSSAIQRQLLKMFDGWPRPLPVPYDRVFMRYFPDHFDEEITLADFLAITADWDATNNRRLNLIEKKTDKTITSEEAEKLQELKRLAGLKRELLSSPSLKELAQVEADLRRRGLWRGA